jgi:hypothetical protein
MGDRCLLFICTIYAKSDGVALTCSSRYSDSEWMVSRWVGSQSALVKGCTGRGIDYIYKQQSVITHHTIPSWWKQRTSLKCQTTLLYWCRCSPKNILLHLIAVKASTHVRVIYHLTIQSISELILINDALCFSADPKTRQMIQRKYKSSMVSSTLQCSGMTCLTDRLISTFRPIRNSCSLPIFIFYTWI